MSRKKTNCALCGQSVTTDDVTQKTSVTIKEYIVEDYRKNGKLVVPVGSEVSNHTALGNDDTYRFWTNFHKVAEEMSGFKNSILKHDLTHYGLNIPAEYCEPYDE